MGSPEDRASYRVRYPDNYPARLLPSVIFLPDQPVTLEDWSEIGLRVRRPRWNTYAADDVVPLSIQCAGSDEAIVTEGTVVWVTEEFVALRINPPGLPWKILLDEQRALGKWRAMRAEPG